MCWPRWRSESVCRGMVDSRSAPIQSRRPQTVTPRRAEADKQILQVEAALLLPSRAQRLREPHITADCQPVGEYRREGRHPSPTGHRGVHTEVQTHQLSSPKSDWLVVEV